MTDYKVPPLGPGETLISKSQIKDLIEAEHWSPEDLFDSKRLDSWFECETRYRAEKAAEAAAKAKETKPAEDKGGGGNPFLDPAHNPLIRLGDEPPGGWKAPDNPNFDPAKNPFLKIDKMA